MSQRLSPLAGRKKFAALATAATLAITATGAAAFVPGNILGGAADSIFGSDGFGSIVGDVFNGDFGSIFSDVLGGGSMFCDQAVTYIVAPEGGSEPNCDPLGSLGGFGGVLGGGAADIGGVGDVVGSIFSGDRSGLFDSVFDIVSGQMGIPSEISDVIFGRQSVGEAVSDITGGILGGIFGDEHQAGIFGDEHQGIMGAAGVPVPQALAEMVSAQQAASARDVGASPLHTIGVNPALMTPTQVTAALSDSVTERAFSEAGQEIIMARSMAGKTVNETSAQMGQGAEMSYMAQMAVAESALKAIDEQTSTQDTLKAALSTSVMLGAQATEFDKIATNQRALDAQMSSLALEVAQENYLMGAASAKNLNRLTEQEQKAMQERAAAKSSLEYEWGAGLRGMGGFAR